MIWRSPGARLRRCPIVSAAWVFVAFHALHSAVHCTINLITVRFSLCLGSTLAVWFMALRAALLYLGA